MIWLELKGGGRRNVRATGDWKRMVDRLSKWPNVVRARGGRLRTGERRGLKDAERTGILSSELRAAGRRSTHRLNFVPCVGVGDVALRRSSVEHRYEGLLSPLPAKSRLIDGFDN